MMMMTTKVLLLCLLATAALAQERPQQPPPQFAGYPVQFTAQDPLGNKVAQSSAYLVRNKVLERSGEAALGDLVAQGASRS